VVGFSGWATAGRWVVYLRGEFQHAPAGLENSPQLQSVLDNIDDNPGLPASPQPARNQARLLDTYVGLNLANWQLSYGQESQWWGPGSSGPLLFSDNAAPMRMFHIDRVSPFRLPSIFHLLGPMRWNAFFGHLQSICFPLHRSFTAKKSASNLRLISNLVSRAPSKSAAQAVP
jgi:Capsule assembly protein Wzi